MQRSVSWSCKITYGLQNVLRVILHYENLRHVTFRHHVIRHRSYANRHPRAILHRSYANHCYVSCLQSCVNRCYVNHLQNCVFLHYGCVLRY